MRYPASALLAVGPGAWRETRRMPLGPYPDWDACVAANQDKRDPEAYCASLEPTVAEVKEKAVPKVVVNIKRPTFAVDETLQIREGTFVEWSFGDGTAQGKVKRIQTEGSIEVDGNVINADPDDPAVLVESWSRVELADGVFFEPTGQDVARRASSLTVIEPLRERPAGSAVETSAARSSTFEAIDFDVPDAPMGAIGPRWEGVLTIEEEMTGDGRMFVSGAVRWETLPVPLRWVRSDEGEHRGAVVVGRIDEVYRDGNLIMGRGVFDAGSEDGLEAARQVAEGLTPGISVDLDDVSFEIRVASEVMGNRDEEFAEVDEDGMMTVLRMSPDDEVMVTTDARLRAATIVATPAFADARIGLLDGAMGLEEMLTAAALQLSDDERRPTEGMATEAQRAIDWRAEGNPGGEDNTVERARSIAAREPLSEDTIRRMHAFFSRNASYPTMDGFSPGDDGYPSPARVAWGLWGGNAGQSWSSTLFARLERQDENAVTASSAVAVRPPASWFADPGLKRPTPLTVTEEGRVYGHLASWGTCHTGFVGECVSPPASATNYAYFRTGAVRTDDGSEVAVGRLTVDTTHAGRRLGPAATASHYEDTGLAVADVTAGEDAHGIWVAGAIRPGTTEEEIRTLMASPLSGDWRRIGGNLELVAALAVNSPGFPIPRVLVASGSVQTLQSSNVVADTAPALAASTGLADDTRLLRLLLDRERAAQRDRESRASAARNRVRRTLASSRFAAATRS